jgi:8-oxo-dGTP pyrophosphatase MutT (NUDIX family)
MESILEENEEFKKRIITALSIDLPYSDRSHRHLSDSQLDQVKPAAVLILFADSKSSSNFSLLYTRRTYSVETHKGQIAFPGGMCEPEDQGQSEITALRETEEELGIPQNRIQILGKMPELVTITGFSISPVVGFLKVPLEQVPLIPHPNEIAEAFWVPFKTLTHSQTYRREFIRVGQVDYPIHVYQVGQYRIWGATGSMTKNLLDRIESLLRRNSSAKGSG